MTREQLIAAARDAAKNAHAPYSNFGVGAALLLEDGRVVTGCNFENASYGLSLCAETVALARANCEGDLRRVIEVAVTGGMIGADGAIGGADIVTPCGRCRQMLNEPAQLARRDIIVHCASADGGAVESFKLSDLLPRAFGPGDLGIS